MISLRNIWNSYLSSLFALLLAFSLGTTSSLASSTERNYNQVYNEAIMFYSRVFPFEYTKTLPVIKIMSKEALVDKMCEDVDNPTACKNRGWLGITNKGVVYLCDCLEDYGILGESVLFHELIHYLQAQRFGGDVADFNQGNPHEQCNDLRAREIEAYTLQLNYVQRHGGGYGAFVSILQVLQGYKVSACP